MNKPKFCCLDLATAHQEGTDNEEYEALAHDTEGVIVMGHMPPIKYCPWCGDDKQNR